MTTDATTMTTAVATVPFASISADSKALRVLAYNTRHEPLRESDLTKVKTPSGGATKWSISHLGNVTEVDEIDGVPVAIGQRGYLWPKDGVAVEGMRPVLTSYDLITAKLTVDDRKPEWGDVNPKSLEPYRTGDKTYDWVALANDDDSPFSWGKGRDGNGRRVKEQRLVALLRDGDTIPLLISIGPGAIVDFNRFLKKLPEVPHQCVIGLRLVPDVSAGGVKFSKIEPRFIRALSDEQCEIIDRIYTQPLERMFSRGEQ